MAAIHARGGLIDVSDQIALGKISGVRDILIAGSFDAIGTTRTTIWDQGGEYTYLTADTTLFISSSSAADTTQSILIQGLDDTLTEIVAVAALSGQSQVTIPVDFFRVISATVLAPFGGDPAGDIYVAETDTLTAGVPDTATKIKAKIIQGQNITRQGLVTVPAGKVYVPQEFHCTCRKSDDMALSVTFRFTANSVFYDAVPFEMYQNHFINTFQQGIVFPAGTDVEFRGTATKNNNKLSFFVFYREYTL